MQNKRLFFLLNFDRQLARQVHAIEYLCSRRTPVSINDLSNEVGCSTPTMRNDINALNNELPRSVQIEANGKDGYLLTYPEGTFMPSIIMDLAKETDVFRIINSLFNQEIYEFDEMVNELFINPCSLRNILSHINKVIEQYNISISTSPIQLVGTESDIRIFFFKFYYDFNDYFLVDPNYEQNRESYQSIINYQPDQCPTKIHLGLFRSTMWTMIIRKRLQLKCYVTLEASFIEEITSTKDYDTFSQAFTDVFVNEFFILNPPQDEIVWMYVALLHCVSYSKPTFNQLCDSNYEYVLHRCTNPDALQLVDDFLSLEFDEHVLKSAHLNKMRAYLLNLMSLSKLSTQFQGMSLTSRSFMTESLEEYYMLWMKNLYSKEGQALFPIVLRDDIALALAMLYSSVLSELKHHDIRVLFAIQGGSGYDDYLVQQIKTMITQNIVPYYVSDQVITEEMIEQSQIDVVVTNYDSPEFYTLSRKVISISYIPTISEWTTLGEAFRSLSTPTFFENKHREQFTIQALA